MPILQILYIVTILILNIVTILNSKYSNNLKF